MFRPKKNQVFEPLNPEYSLIDAMTEEVFVNYSPELAYWSLNEPTTEASRDELDKLYGEKSSDTGKITYDGPFQVYGTLQINPIIQELTKVGLQQIEEIDFYVNIAAMAEYIEGRYPKYGDVLRVTYIETDNSRRYVFYNIANVTPVDLYNFRHINYLLNGEQTMMADVPEEIRNYSEGQ